MKKFFLFLLAAALLCVSAPAGAEYSNYRLTVGDPYGYTTVFPLDAHNAIVRVRSYREDDAPWHVTWYRDGQVFSDIAGEEAIQYNNEADLVMPIPTEWDGSRLSVCYRVRTGELKTVWGLYGQILSPDSFETRFAQWTEDGLKESAAAPASWDATYENGQIKVYVEGDAWRILDGEAEYRLPRNAADNETIVICRHASADTILLKIQTSTSGAWAVCLDRGQVRYKTALPSNESIEDRIMLPDPSGGFFIMDGFRPGNYDPAHLLHYGADGQQDRRLTLRGNKVVVNAIASATDPESGRFILYGSAVANSRKVYTIFALTLDENLNTVGLEVRNIDKAYGDYDPAVFTTPDGTAWVYINEVAGPDFLWPVLIPFSELKESKKDYGVTLR